MIRSLIKLGLILVVGILIYNYFLGTPEEKATSKQIFNEVKDLGKATFNLLKSEKAKFDEGKYDEAVDKVEGIFNRLRGYARDARDSGMLDRVEELEDQRLALKQRLEDSERSNGGLSESERQAIRRDWDRLMSETEQLMKEMENK